MLEVVIQNWVYTSQRLLAVMIFSAVLCYSKKYLSQKNVVEKMNANVMQGKVRHVTIA